eukprot:4675388-Karenia_brevis.AAC.1
MGSQSYIGHVQSHEHVGEPPDERNWAFAKAKKTRDSQQHKGLASNGKLDRWSKKNEHVRCHHQPLADP